jgi:tetratricopeptide (TPR) repeat protein
MKTNLNCVRAAENAVGWPRVTGAEVSQVLSSWSASKTISDASISRDIFNSSNDTATAPRDACPKAKASTLQALQVDDKLAEAHTALAQVLLQEFDMAGSIAEFQRAIAVNPNYATVHEWYANGPLAAVGRFDESIAERLRAIELDALSPCYQLTLGADSVPGAPLR